MCGVRVGEVFLTGLLGANSLVGGCLLKFLGAEGRQVVAFSRRAYDGADMPGVTWLRRDPSVQRPSGLSPIQRWLCVAPIWVLPDYFSMIEAYGARRVVALSSTSRFTKMAISGTRDNSENAMAVRLAEGEERLKAWARSRSIECVILRPTLIYGFGVDKNIAEIARFIRCFGFFPLLGKARGLRQPIHAEDVAAACLAALAAPGSVNRAYNISGGETLPYREMVSRVFTALQRPRLMLTVPLDAFKLTLVFLRLVPRYRHWSSAMAERMNRDIVFDHADAATDLGFSPRRFQITAEDLPR